jgi:hypothetical protein
VTVVVDDLSSRFSLRPSGGRRAREGYLDHSYWTPTRARTASVVATWKPALLGSGRYRIVVKVPPRHATTERAAYRIRTTGGWVRRVLDQRATRGRWVRLGTFELTASPLVRLSDRTGERSALGRRVAFDAIRFVPVGEPSVASVTDAPENEAGTDTTPQAEPEAPAAQTDLEPTVPRDTDDDATPKPNAEPTPDSARKPAPYAEVEAPTPEPTREPDRTREPTPEPTAERTSEPTPEPTAERTSEPIAEPTREPDPTPAPPPDPTAPPSEPPTPEPATQPAAEPSAEAVESQPAG